MRRKIYISKKLMIVLIGLAGLLLLYTGWRILRPKPKYIEPQIKLYLQEENSIVTLKLEDYIIGTVAAEMPASFEMEALKAQAVAARTYTVCKMLNGAQYPLGADLSDDTRSCQAYVSREKFGQLHSYKTQELWNKISQAVSLTRGEVLLYQGQPIDAMYCSTCGGRTVSAAESGGSENPNLQSVPCDYCKASKYYNLTQLYKYANMDSEAQKLLGQKPTIHILSTTDSGRIKKIQINEKILSGEEFRQALDLPSTWFKIDLDPQGLIINSRGYGHGIGLCQYGANGMAKDGIDYQKILHKYYQKVEIYKINY